jgi:HK97 family phage prohead protease
METYDFHGWATKNNIRCSDGRTIMRDAFKNNDGETVPLVWNHNHEDPNNVLGHALLENREEGVYAWCKFNDTENGQIAKVLVQHGDITRLSIYANQLRQQGGNVLHGAIREVSLVHAGANPGATISSVIRHSEDGEPITSEEESIITSGEELSLYHSDDGEKEKPMAEETKDTKSGSDKTVKEVWDDITKKLDEDEMSVIYAMIGQAAEGGSGTDDEGDGNMKHNVFDQEEVKAGGVLTHADQVQILANAKQTGVGSLQKAIAMFQEENGTLAHGLDLGDAEVLEELIPDHKLLNPGAPEILKDYETNWVMGVINKIHKSPYARIRTRKADARQAELKAKGYKKGEEKKFTNHIKLLGRKTEPTTIYLKDQLNRDDIIDIEDFDVVSYIWNMMKDNMYETLALCALVGDGRDDADPDKISETNIRPIWKDDDFYTIHQDVDIAKAKEELQGSNTGANFGENYIYAEAMITAALYSREKFKGSGTPTLYCTPHLVNVMLLARDLNGRRIYDSKADLARALNVAAIVEIEQLEGRTRTTEDGEEKKLLGLFVNLADYQFGSAKGGEITKFTDFDIDFNKYKYLMETRLSGALTEPFSAIALEEPVVAEG